MKNLIVVIKKKVDFLTGSFVTIDGLMMAICIKILLNRKRSCHSCCFVLIFFHQWEDLQFKIDSE